MKMHASLLVILVISNISHAENTVNPSTTTFGSIGSNAPVTQTTTVPLKVFDSGTSVGGYSTTTVTGGSTTNGAGGIIPDGTSGSTSYTSYGIGVSIPLDGTN